MKTVWRRITEFCFLRQGLVGIGFQNLFITEQLSMGFHNFETSQYFPVAFLIWYCEQMEKRLLPILLALAFLTGCSSTDLSPPKRVAGLTLVEVPGESTGFSCTAIEDPNFAYCIMAIRIKNQGDVSKDIFGDVFALVDGRVFKADSTFGGLTYVSTDINPGESAASTVAFKVPRGSLISQIFISDSADGGLESAKLILDLNKIAAL